MISTSKCCEVMKEGWPQATSQVLTVSDILLSFPDTGVDRMSSLIRAAAMWGYPELVRELGGHPDAFFRRFHIPAGAEHQEDAFISFASFVRMLEASADDLRCPDFGLRLSSWQGLDILGPIAVIARNAQTVLGGFEAIARYLYVHSPALTLTVERGSAAADVQFTYAVTESGVPYPAQGYELSMGIGVRILRLLGGPQARPRLIAFTHDQKGSTAAYREVLDCPVRFGQTWCGFELPAHVADRRIDAADPETLRIATKYLESTYLPSTAPLSERVAELTRRLLPTGQCSADAIANELALHPRTLQRRLAAEGMRCQDVIDRERRTQAGRYLAEPGFHLSQIAGLLGYTEQSALNRSCRRWFGKTPRQYRADLVSS
jgi:AraC-like DNA-binding protein